MTDTGDSRDAYASKKIQTGVCWCGSFRIKIIPKGGAAQFSANGAGWWGLVSQVLSTLLVVVMS